MDLDLREAPGAVPITMLGKERQGTDDVPIRGTGSVMGVSVFY
jgi:hypothetical protein